jgi:hypothetical protein
MKRLTYYPRGNREGSTLVLALIMIVMLSALAVAMASMSGANVQVADNYRKLDNTRGSAESGLEVMRYWISKVAMSGNIAPSQRFSELASSLQGALTDAGITNIVPVHSGSTITISNVPLNSLSGQNFSAVLTKINDDKARLEVTGHYGPISRTIRSDLIFSERADTVFDFGVATKGPLILSGSVEIDGVNINVESNAYIESPDALLALSISGNSHIAGEVKIVNPSADVFLGSKAGVGGETVPGAYEHITKGVPPSDFPEMATATFASYATNVLSPTVDLKKAVTLTNIRIPAGMNPSFSGQATLQGVIFIEWPNIVEFTGGVDITGVIVTDGSQSDDSGTSQLIFRGNVVSRSVAELPQETQFAGLHGKTGTFVMAPGFAVSFGGTFSALNGVIAANGVEFFGNAGGTVDGSVINYADKDMTVSGNSTLQFNRSGRDKVPAGFKPQIIVHYDPTSYSEVAL